VPGNLHARLEHTRIFVAFTIRMITQRTGENFTMERTALEASADLEIVSFLPIL
jgi:hypothetical protein